MKKVLLSITALAFSLVLSAQTTTVYSYSAGFDGTPYSTGACLLNLNGNSVGGYEGGNVKTLTFLGTDPNAKALKFIGSSIINPSVSPYLADMFFALGDDPATASCATYRANFIGVDMSTNNNVSITCKSDMAGDTLEFFLGSSSDGGWPSSTFSFGDSKSIVRKIAISDVMTEYNFNYTTLDVQSLSSSNAAWADWEGKALVNMWGLRIKRADAVIEVGNVELGYQPVVGLSGNEVVALGLTFAPNPATETLTVSYNSQAGKNVVVSLSNGVNEVASTVGSDSSATLNVSNLASGLYFATVSVNGAYATTSKVLVK